MRHEEALRRYAQQRRNFDAVLHAAIAIDRRVGTVPAASPKAFVGAVLATKALGHAIGIDKIAPPLTGERVFYDFPSVAVLLRALTETYLAFRYVSIEPTSEEELEFRDALMDYHHCCKHFKLVQHFRPEGVTIEHAISRKSAARKRLESNAFFRSQGVKARSRQLDGKDFAHRSLEEVAETAGIHRSAWGTIYVYLSQITHAAPMTVKLMSSFVNEESRGPRTLSWLLAWSSGFLAKLLLDFEALYPGSLGVVTSVQTQVMMAQAVAVANVRPQEIDEDATSRQ